jgi:hypothetical protein
MGRKVENIELETIPIDEVVQRLEKAGIAVDREETELIIEFLHNLTYLVLQKYFQEP